MQRFVHFLVFSAPDPYRHDGPYLSGTCLGPQTPAIVPRITIGKIYKRVVLEDNDLILQALELIRGDQLHEESTKWFSSQEY